MDNAKIIIKALISLGLVGGGYYCFYAGHDFTTTDWGFLLLLWGSNVGNSIRHEKK